MPRRRMMDMMMRDSRRIRRMRDRGMRYEYDMRNSGVRGSEYGSMDGNYSNSQYSDSRGRRDYESGRQSDMALGDYGDMRGRRRNSRGQYMSDRGYEEMDGHYPMSQGSTYFPIEAMGRFTGYWGEPEEDYRRGRKDYGDYNYDMRYDMRGGRDYGYYDMGGDYGETLTKEELEEWKHKLMKEVDDKYKSFFTKENIAQKAKQMGIQMEEFSEDELLLATMMVYTDYCKALKPYIGENMDAYVKIAHAFLVDKDASVKGGEKLAVYYDNIVEEE